MQPCFEVVDVQKRENVSRPPQEEISPIPPIACVWMDDMAYAALEMDLTLVWEEYHHAFVLLKVSKLDIKLCSENVFWNIFSL